MNKDQDSAFAIAAYHRLVEEKHHYDNLSWLIGGVILVFTGALIAYTPTIKAEHYLTQVLMRLILTFLVWTFLYAWHAIYQRNRMWGEAANEAMRDLEAEFHVRGAGTVFREYALSNEVVLKNIDWNNSPLVIRGKHIQPRTEKVTTSSIHIVVRTLTVLTAIVALAAALIR